MIEITQREAATIRAALSCWLEELAEGGEWIPDSLVFSKQSPLSASEVKLLSDRLESTPDRRGDEFRLIVPTYSYRLYPKYVESGKKLEYGPPEAAAVVRDAQGIRIVLGTHNYDDVEKPDIQIERHPNGWMFFLHPLGRSDACGYMYIVDDGRSYLLPEYGYGSTPQIKVLKPGSRLPEFDGPD